MQHLFSTDLFVSLTSELGRQGIKYFILRNYEGLPDYNPSKDVDILIKQDQSGRVLALLEKIAEELGYTLVWKNNLDYLYGVVFLKIEDDIIYSIKIDLFRSFSWRGMYYIDDRKLFEGAESYHDFLVPQFADEAFTMIMYYVLYAKQIRSKYYQNIVNKALSNEGRFRELLNDHVSTEITEEILVCIREGRVADIVKFRPYIVKGVIQRNKCLVTCFNLFKHIVSEISNFRNPWRLIVNRFIQRKYGYRNKEIWIALADIGVGEREYSKLTSVFFFLINGKS